MPYELVKRLKEAFPTVKVQNLYGQTENSPAATSLKDDAALIKIGSVGKPLARTEVIVVDSDGNALPAGVVGEICVKGPQVMKGYLRNPEETSLAIRNGWLYSGDLGRFDEEGYLFIVDRKKDMIIRGGENIYPIEVEEVLYQISEVLEAAVVGIPHEVYGEVPKAFVVLKEGYEQAKDEIAPIQENLAKQQITIDEAKKELQKINERLQTSNLDNNEKNEIWKTFDKLNNLEKDVEEQTLNEEVENIKNLLEILTNKELNNLKSTIKNYKINERPIEVQKWINQSSQHFAETINEASQDKNWIARTIWKWMQKLM